MGLKVGCVDHDDLGIAPLGGQFGQDARKDAQTAPPHPAVIKRLGWTIFGRRIAPAQPIAIDKYYSTQNTLIIDPWNPMRQRKERLETLHLRVSQPE